jgi:ParB family chromosome partitioning protein
MDNKFLTYRGEVRALIALGGTVVFTTVHPEGQPTALYTLDADKLQLRSEPLPCGAIGLAGGAEGIWVLGVDGTVRAFSGTGKAASPPGAAGPIVLLAGDRLAHVAGAEVLVLARKGLNVLQRLALPEDGSALAADPTGQWIVAGTSKGNVYVFESEDKNRFDVSSHEKLHEGAVTSLLFEPQELRFYSAGADNKLLSTHARGKLEAEDKGRGGNHTDQVVSMVWGPADRFFTGSRDKTVKSWPRASNLRPNTLKDNVITVKGIAIVQLHKKQQLCVACDDNTLRFFALDDEGKFGDPIVKVGDAYARAKAELNREETTRREAALRDLASYNDTPAIEMIGAQIPTDADHGLRVLGTELLGNSGHPKAVPILEKSLSHADEAVRVAALTGLRKHLGQEDLRPLDLALKAEKADVGRLAVQALEKLAAKDDQALGRLSDALNVKTWEVRQAALASLEKIYPAESPEANLVALSSTFADLRRLTLIRLFQRKMLGHPKVQAIVRWRGEDADAEVRRTAFLLSLYMRDKLVETLREADPELQRQLAELESLGPDGTPMKLPEVETAKPAKSKTRAGAALSEDDLSPLLQATASRALDTCLRGARGLSVLHDPRAFGLLLQLSREDDNSARVEVCRALSILEDSRAIKRLGSLLFDKEASVRDAAFSALQHLYVEEPLRCAELGLGATFQDVRRRGLQLLIEHVRKNLPQNDAAQSWQLLVRALNDSFADVRTEAFKSALNVQIAGGGPNTLRFVLQSVHADIRREVLTEVMAQINEPWAWPLLLTFFNDPDPKLREEAFAFAQKRSKELEPLEAALTSKHIDIRRAAVHALIKKHTPRSQALLVDALKDEEKEIRQLSLEALVDAEAEDALLQVLDSNFPDVRVRAARALARYGNKAALAPLLKLATAPEPDRPERVAEWSGLVEAALDGLAELGDPDALATLAGLLFSKHATHRKGAARALVWSARAEVPDALDTLRQVMQHADPQVKYNAALGLAYAGDAFVLNLLFSTEANQVIPPPERLVAALTLGQAGEDQQAVYLDDADENIRNQVLMLVLLLELKDNRGAPTRLLACLSSLMPRVRLTAARALEVFNEPAEFLAFVVEVFNDRGDTQPWKIPQETVESLALLVAHGSPLTRARSALLLGLLSQKEQEVWDQAWSAHSRRFASELALLRELPPPARKPQHTNEQLRELAFGAYVGLVRDQGKAQREPAARLVSLRRTALHRLVILARTGDHFLKSAIPVLIQAMGDPNKDVRLLAFEYLQNLGLDPTTLGAEALETGHTDLGVKGLEVLTAAAGAVEGQAVLERVMLSRKDDLALESARLLSDRRGIVPVAVQAFEAAHEPLRDRAVVWLTGEYDKDDKAKISLRDALKSRYLKVRESTAIALAGKKDPAAFDALVKLLQAAQDANKQRWVIQNLTALGDPRTPDTLLDRIEKDPGGTALTDDLFKAAANFRKPATAERLFAMMDRNPKWRRGCYLAIRTIGGHDQKIDDPNEEKENREWLTKQHPRHDALLARLMETCQAAGEVKQLVELMPEARFARGAEVQPVLAQLAGHPDDALRRKAAEALGWRLRKRNGTAEPLLKALSHADPETQLNAAEGLARAGRGEGLSVLLSAIDVMQDQSQRERAVLALGELGDRRALDTLLKLASEEANPLQAAASEAIGHLGKSDRVADIYQLLERYSRGGSMCSAALKGLRWLDTPDSWKLIRERAADSFFSARALAVSLLGNNDDQATREVILNLLANDNTVINQAIEAARKLWGAESLEPDYALVQNNKLNAYQKRDPLDRVCNRGDATRIIDILPKTTSGTQDDLARSVMTRKELPADAARKALSVQETRTCQLGAQIVGRLGVRAGNCESLLASALKYWRGEWEKKRQTMFQTGTKDASLEAQITPCVRALIWASGRLGVGYEQIMEAAETRPDDPLYRLLRLEAVAALANFKMTGNVADVLLRAAQGNDPAVRTLAADELGRGDPARAAQLAEKLLNDNTSFGRIADTKTVQLDPLLKSAVRQVHYQGVVLPPLLDRRDIETLTSLADDKSLPLVARLGAVEGLASLTSEDAEARLVRVGQREGEEEDLRKAAWRGLRRSRRARKKVRTI